MQPSKALIKFHEKFFSGTNIPVDNVEIFTKLLDELNRLRREKSDEVY